MENNTPSLIDFLFAKYYEEGDAQEKKELERYMNLPFIDMNTVIQEENQ